MALAIKLCCFYSKSPGQDFWKKTFSHAWPVTKHLLNLQGCVKRTACNWPDFNPDTRSRDQSWGMEEGILKVSEDLPMVVMTVAAKIIALGQFQLLKVWFPVMATPCPAASDTI